MQSGTRIGPPRSRYRLTTNDKIDVCRGFFAYLVVVAHAPEVTPSMCPIPESHLGVVSRQILVGSVGTGIYSVMGFFVISGYCIQLSVHRLEERGTFPLRTYLVARLTRILPLYYVALLFTVLAEWWIAPAWLNIRPDGLSATVLACQAVLIQNLTQTYGSFSSFLGLSSDPTYLFHGPLMMIVGSVLIRLSLVSDWRWVWLVLALSGIATGIAGGYLVEEPLMAWRAGFLRKFAGARAASKAGAHIRRPIPAAR